MSIQKGTFVLLDYTGSVKETGEVFDTTSEDEAKKRGLNRPGGRYEPQLVVVGEGWVVKGLDEALLSVEIEKPTRVEVPPEKGLGQRDPSKMRLVPLRRFRAREVTPRPGLEVEVDGRPAVVRAVGAGRVQVDFNPPLAGRTLVYEATVKGIVGKTEDKVKALIHRRIPSVPQDSFGVRIEEGNLHVTVPQEAFLAEGLQYVKRGIASDVERFIPEIRETTFVEVYPRTQPAPEESRPSQAGKTQPEPEPKREAAASGQPQASAESPSEAAAAEPEPQPKKRRARAKSRRSSSTT